LHQKKKWFTRHETDRFLNIHCQECVRAYLSIHDSLSFHEVMIGNHRTIFAFHNTLTRHTILLIRYTIYLRHNNIPSHKIQHNIHKNIILNNTIFGFRNRLHFYIFYLSQPKVISLCLFPILASCIHHSCNHRKSLSVGIGRKYKSVVYF
jgi:hypothetical protein